jgi:alkylation response protein AidB-like acyl-CoA dehydrogenase
MNLEFTDQERSFRAEARAWLGANVPREQLGSGDTAEGFARHLEWEKRLFEAGWSVVAWPEEYGGRGASLIEWLIFEEEYYRAGAPSRVTQNGVFLLAPTLFEFGTKAQKDRYLRNIASATELWCQGWSEPNAGSDLAGLQATARRVEGGWLLTGQKTWTTRGAFCDFLFGPFRTDPAATRHKGLSYFMVPLRAEGVTVRPVERLDGDPGFAEVFFDEAFVGDDMVIGEVNQGWHVAMATTSSERGLSLRSPGRFMATASKLVELHRRRLGRGNAVSRDAVARGWIEAEAYRWHTYATAARMIEGKGVGAESSINKLFWSEMDLKLHETALGLLGETAELESGASLAADDGAWVKGFQFALAGPIYAGTNEVQRNIVAERVLGLPKG